MMNRFANFAKVGSLLTVVALAALISHAADKAKTGVGIYEEFPPSLRPFLKQAYSIELKRRTRIVADLRTAVARAKAPDAKKEAESRFDDAKEALESLKENDPPFVGIQRTVTHPNTFSMRSWVIGDIGIDTDPDGLTVLQVIDKSSAILIQETDGGGRQTILIEGVDTSGWVDGDTYPIMTAIWVSGTTTYKTAIGGSNTVLKAERFDWDRYRKSFSPQKAK